MGDAIAITKIVPDDHIVHRIVEIWEASVRATHTFLCEADIEYYREMVTKGIYDYEETYAAISGDSIIGFMVCENGLLEMLFVHPDYFGYGIGSILIKYAFEDLNITKVDVNEQNFKALDFYRRKGFVVISRDETDPSGKPYPILHMELADH